MYYARHWNNFKFRVVTTALLTGTLIQPCVVHSFSRCYVHVFSEDCLLHFKLQCKLFSSTLLHLQLQPIAKLGWQRVISELLDILEIRGFL